MTRAFFIVGPTATGKSEIAADVAREVGAEIVSADAFQIYRVSLCAIRVYKMTLFHSNASPPKLTNRPTRSFEAAR